MLGACECTLKAARDGEPNFEEASGVAAGFEGEVGDVKAVA